MTAKQMGKAVALLEGKLTTFNLRSLFSPPLENERDNIAKWLSHIDFDLFLSENISKRAKGSGTWVLNSQRLTDWLFGNFRLLWCSGNRKCYCLIISIILLANLNSWCWKDNDYVCIHILP